MWLIDFSEKCSAVCVVLICNCGRIISSDKIYTSLLVTIYHMYVKNTVVAQFYTALLCFKSFKCLVCTQFGTELLWCSERSVYDIVASNLKLFVICYFFVLLYCSVERLIVRVSRYRNISWNEQQAENDLNFRGFWKSRLLSEMNMIYKVKFHRKQRLEFVTTKCQSSRLCGLFSKYKINTYRM
jgi:hypothetical protein